MDVGGMINSIGSGIVHGVEGIFGDTWNAFSSECQQALHELEGLSSDLIERLVHLKDDVDLIEGVTLAYTALLFLRIPHALQTLNKLIDLYIAGELHAFIAANMRSGKQDLVQQIYDVRDAKAKIITYNLGQADLIHQQIVALQAADADLHQYMNTLMEHLSATIQYDTHFADEISTAIEHITATVAGGNLPPPIMAMDGILIGGAELQLGLDVPWDAVTLIFVLGSLLIWDAFHPSPAAQALQDIQNGVTSWYGKTMSPADVGDIAPPTIAVPGEPILPNPKNFPIGPSSSLLGRLSLRV